jgi:NDP-sugar pyrophosphorylase family protein
MTDLLIIAAGTGSRLRASVPKALFPIAGKKCLTNTLTLALPHFERIIITTNVMINEVWRDYFNELKGQLSPEDYQKIIQCAIPSGIGDGHALMETLSRTQEGSDDVVVMWGDVYLESDSILVELLSKPFETINNALIPAVSEQSPYVTLLVDRNFNCVSADFSKHGENHLVGLHDQSIFRFNRAGIYSGLKTLHASAWKNGRYILPAGELSTLYVFHLFYNLDQPAQVYVTDYCTRTFNTLEEVESIERALTEASE